MKIIAVSTFRSLNFENKLQDKNNQIKSSPLYFGEQISSIYYKPLGLISFKGIIEDENKLKGISGIKCASCGAGFIEKDEYKALDSPETVATSKINVEKLLPYQDRMAPIERKVFNILKSMSKAYPEENFQELLGRIYLHHFKPLKIKQRQILDSARLIADGLSEDKKSKVQCALGKSEYILFEEPNETLKKRYRAIEQIREIPTEDFSKEDKKIYLDILTKLLSLPTSSQSVNTFIVKYANRTPNEISRRLVESLLPTVEHVVPLSQGGKDTINNKIILCKKCNAGRKNMSYESWLKSNPQMRQNLQNFIDIVIETANINELEGFDDYPKAIKTLFKDVGIKLNLAKLKMIKKDTNIPQAQAQVQASLDDKMAQVDKEISTLKKELGELPQIRVLKDKIEAQNIGIMSFQLFLSVNLDKFKQTYPDLVTLCLENTNTYPKTVSDFIGTYNSILTTLQDKRRKQVFLAEKIRLLEQENNEDTSENNPINQTRLYEQDVSNAKKMLEDELLKLSSAIDKETKTKINKRIQRLREEINILKNKAIESKLSFEQIKERRELIDDIEALKRQRQKTIEKIEKLKKYSNNKTIIVSYQKDLENMLAKINANRLRIDEIEKSPSSEAPVSTKFRQEKPSKDANRLELSLHQKSYDNLSAQVEQLSARIDVISHGLKNNTSIDTFLSEEKRKSSQIQVAQQKKVSYQNQINNIHAKIRLLDRLKSHKRELKGLPSRQAMERELQYHIRRRKSLEMEFKKHLLSFETTHPNLLDLLRKNGCKSLLTVSNIKASFDKIINYCDDKKIKLNNLSERIKKLEKTKNQQPNNLDISQQLEKYTATCDKLNAEIILLEESILKAKQEMTLGHDIEQAILKEEKITGQIKLANNKINYCQNNINNIQNKIRQQNFN